MTTHVTLDDLKLAVDWLRSYESGPDPDDTAEKQCGKVADYLQAEIDRRAEAIAVRTLAREIGAQPGVLRAALRYKRDIVRKNQS